MKVGGCPRCGGYWAGESCIHCGYAGRVLTEEERMAIEDKRVAVIRKKRGGKW